MRKYTPKTVNPLKQEVRLISPKASMVVQFVLCGSYLLLGISLLYRHMDHNGHFTNGIGFLFLFLALRSLVGGVNRYLKLRED